MRNGKLVIGIILLVGLLFGCGDSDIGSLFGSTGYDLTIGTTGEDGIAEEKSRFRAGEEITIELEGSKAIGSFVKVSILKKGDDVENLLITENIDIDPTWTWMYYSFGQFPESGDFVIRLFSTEDVLLDEVDFSIFP